MLIIILVIITIIFMVMQLLLNIIHNIQNNKHIEQLTILETGTARGFADIVMANVLKQNNMNGKIHTIDWIGHIDKIEWNSIDTPNGTKESRYNLLQNWCDLRDNYINFITGDSKKILKTLNFS